MTASTPRKEPSGQPQRIFMNAGKVVDRPPTLFRMPTVKKPLAAECPGAAGRASAAAASPPPMAPAPVAPASCPAAYAAAAAPAGSAQAVGTRAAAAQAAAAPHFAPHISSAHATVASLEPLASQAPLAPQAAVPEMPAPEGPPTGCEPSAHRRVHAPAQPAPSPQSWMESIGSRLMLLLLIAAIAAVAYLANRSGAGPDETTFVGLDAEEEAAAERGKLAMAKNQSADAETALDLESAAPTKAPSELASAVSTPAAAASAATAPTGAKSGTTERHSTLNATSSRGTNSATSSGSTAKAATPQFDLADLQGGDTQPAKSQALKSQASRSQAPNSGPASPALAAAGDAAPPAGRRAALPNDRLVAEPRPEPSKASNEADGDRFLSEGISAEEAILAAVDAAVAAPPRGTANGHAAEYATTDQPTGVSNWLDFLPPAHTDVPPSFGAGRGFGDGAATTADGGDAAALGGMGAGVPYARTATNSYSANSQPNWDGGYAVPAGATAAISPSAGLPNGYPGLPAPQGYPGYGAPGETPLGSSPYGDSPYGNPPAFDHAPNSVSPYGSAASGSDNPYGTAAPGGNPYGGSTPTGNPYGALPSGSPAYQNASAGTQDQFDTDFSAPR